MVTADTMNGATVVVVEEEGMKDPLGRDRHHHAEGFEDAEVAVVAEEDIIEAERKWKYWIILPNILINKEYCIHNNYQLGIPILILKRTNLVDPC